MTISVVANAANTPPQFEITIATPDGSAMTAVTLYRQVFGSKTQTRVQPTSGVASRFITDPEADWDTPVTYIAQVTYNGGASTTTLTSTPATLVPAPLAMWAIHPTVPGLSIPLDVGTFTAAGLVSIGDIGRAAQATRHQILGSSYPVVTKLGNRASSTGQLTVKTTTASEANALLSIVNDETPILIRAPHDWGWAWEDGYYAIGDITESRPFQYGPDPGRQITLPYQRVQAPAGTQQSTWSWADLLAHYADWPSVIAAFDDWNAVIGDNPS